MGEHTKDFKKGDFVVLRGADLQHFQDGEPLSHTEVHRIFKMINRTDFRLEECDLTIFCDWAFDNLGPDLPPLVKVIYGL